MFGCLRRESHHVNVGVKGSKTAPAGKHCFREEEGEEETVGLLHVVPLLLLY